MTGKIPLAGVPVKAPPANTIIVWPKAHPLMAEAEDGALSCLIDLSAFKEDEIERIDLSQGEPLPAHWITPSIEMAAAIWTAPVFPEAVLVESYAAMPVTSSWA